MCKYLVKYISVKKVPTLSISSGHYYPLPFASGGQCCQIHKVLILKKKKSLSSQRTFRDRGFEKMLSFLEIYRADLDIGCLQIDPLGELSTPPSTA